MRRPSELWGRRVAAGGVVLLALAALGGGILVATDDDDSKSDDAAQEERDQELQQIADERLSREVVDEAQGISARIPKGWTQERQADVITLESPDRCVSIALAVPGKAAESKSILEDTIAGLRRELKGAQVDRGAGQVVGGLTGPGAVLEVKGADGEQVRALITVGEGDQNAYLTQVVLRSQGCREALVDSQLVVNSIVFTK